MPCCQVTAICFGLLISACIFSDRAEADETNTFYWRGQVSDDWRDSANWNKSPGTENSYPRSARDKVVIQPAHTCDVVLDRSTETGLASGVTVGELIIEAGASLTLASNTLSISSAAGRSGKLTIQREGFLTGALNINARGVLKLDSPVTHEIGGTIKLNSASSDLIVLDDCAFEPWHWFTGDVIGTVTGRRDSAEIRIAQNKTLTNSVIIAGRMFIHAARGQATLKMNAPGILWANGNGSLELEDNLILTDSASGAALPLYKSAGTLDSILRIKAQARDLVGHFEVSECGRIDFVSDVATTGDLLLIHGRIEVAPNRRFIFDADDEVSGSMLSSGKCKW